MKKPSPEHLIEEYKSAQQSVDFHNRMAWQIGGIFIAGSIAGFSVLASKLSEIDQLQELFGLFFAGAFSIAIFELWFRIYLRWDTYDKVAHHRSQEIEKDLGLRLNRDIEIKRDKQREQKLENDDPERLQKLRDWFSERSFELGTAERTTVKWSVKVIKRVIVASWILLFVAALLQYLCKLFISVLVML